MASTALAAVVAEVVETVTSSSVPIVFSLHFIFSILDSQGNRASMPFFALPPLFTTADAVSLGTT
ncbi:hypothetical protein TYRP_018744 [Tyrophagus putrescentiae]|nr:hypothetical protein TYRP_018744 [Tyrophagus putrescentiae]